MVEIWYVDGDKESIELKPVNDNPCFPFKYFNETECFLISGISEIITVPREFIKSIRYIEV